MSPEAHRVSWFAHLRGRKRWLLSPPDAAFPAAAIARVSGGDCAPRPRLLAKGALQCDAPLGSILWLPRWWHETCNVDDYVVGVGGFPNERRAGFRAHPLPRAKPILLLKLRDKLAASVEEYAVEAVFMQSDCDPNTGRPPGDGRLSHMELLAVLETQGIRASGQGSGALFTYLDRDHDGFVNYSELFAGLGLKERGRNMHNRDEL